MIFKINKFVRILFLNFETRFDTSKYELIRPLLKGKNKKVIAVMKDELGGKIMT